MNTFFQIKLLGAGRTYPFVSKQVGTCKVDQGGPPAARQAGKRVSAAHPRSKNPGSRNSGASLRLGGFHPSKIRIGLGSNPRFAILPPRTGRSAMEHGETDLSESRQGWPRLAQVLHQCESFSLFSRIRFGGKFEGVKRDYSTGGFKDTTIFGGAPKWNEIAEIPGETYFCRMGLFATTHFPMLRRF